MSASIHDVCDYVILRCAAAGSPLNNLKLQKLLYYAQAWNLAFDRGRLFEGQFQAWVHGPVNREIYDRFVESKSLYSEVLPEDVRHSAPQSKIPPIDLALIDAVLESYAKLSGVDLERMSHEEQPWLEARGGIAPFARCETPLSEVTMREYYKSRLQPVA